MPLIRVKWLRWLLGCWLFGLSVSSLAATTTLAPLPPEKAFAFRTVVDNKTQVSVIWQMAPGYYLYAERTHVTVASGEPADIRYPDSVIKKDAVRGDFAAYSGQLVIPVVFSEPVSSVQLRVAYQGCSEQGFCYAPVQKNLTLYPASNVVTQTAVTWQHLLTNQNNVQSLFYNQHTGVMLLLFVGLGLLLAFTPCVLPMIPIMTSLIVGQQGKVSTSKAFLLSLTYVMGMALTYAFAGMMAALFGTSLQIWVQKPIFIILGTVVLVLLAISIFGFYELKFLRHWQRRVMTWSHRHEGGTFAGVFLMGIFSTLLISPCVTAPLVGVLVYIGNTGDLVLGASALFAIGLGMGLPLLLIGTSAGKWLPKSGAWMEAVRKSFGILMLAMAIWLLSRILTPMVTVMLWGALLVGIAGFIAFYLPRHMGRHTFNRGVGALLGLAGLLLMLSGVGTLGVVDTFTNPPNKMMGESAFKVVRNMAQLKLELAKAQSAKMPVLLDFYADWCDACIAMEKQVFESPKVKNALGGFVLLRADLSANNAADEEMLRFFKVIAPPTVLFFNVKGHELNEKRIVGEMSHQEFLARLNLFTAAGCEQKLQC